MHIKINDLLSMNERYRATLINSLAGYKTAVLIGTQSKAGQTNLCIFNSLIHLGANPALFGLIFRPKSEERDTLRSILETGYYTLNYVPSDLYKQAHQTSARYENNQSEFTEVGFNEEYLPEFEAPFVQQAVVKIAMKLEEKMDIKINGTSLVIGSIQDIIFNEKALSKDGFIDLSQLDVLGCIGLDAYFNSTIVGRLNYAKPGQRTTEIEL
jgi:flavin reductase (DIM6/NTAB) family NADH-FMN oxidoreductase RutF